MFRQSRILQIQHRPTSSVVRLPPPLVTRPCDSLGTYVSYFIFLYFNILLEYDFHEGHLPHRRHSIISCFIE